MSENGASEYTQEQVTAATMRAVRMAQLAHELAMVHIQDNDELGEIARELAPLAENALQAIMDLDDE